MRQPACVCKEQLVLFFEGSHTTSVMNTWHVKPQDSSGRPRVHYLTSAWRREHSLTKPLPQHNGEHHYLNTMEENTTTSTQWRRTPLPQHNGGEHHYLNTMEENTTTSTQWRRTPLPQHNGGEPLPQHNGRGIVAERMDLTVFEDNNT